MNLRGRNKISPEFNLSSMTDVVFLLLIFFMIASTLAKQLNTIKVKLPEAEGKSENRNAVAVTITNSKKFFIDSNITPKSNLEDKIISTFSSTNSLSLILRAEEKVPIDEVIFVMNIANKNGIKVVLAVDSQ